jgi:hypothetical protein
MSLLKNLYTIDDNFLVKIVPENKVKPFQAIDNWTEIKEFIESSNYRGNQYAMDAIAEILNLNIIVLNCTINTNGEPNIIISNTFEFEETVNNYMFLYLQDNNYELICFKDKKTSVPNKTIFSNTNDQYPPLYLLFFIFSYYYYNERTRNYNKFLLDIFYIFQKTMQHIAVLKDATDIQFKEIFKQYFNKNVELIKAEEVEPEGVEPEGVEETKEEDEENNEYPFEGGQRGGSINVNACYNITIYLELQKGTSLTSSELNNLKCKSKWNAVRKAYATFRGIPYTPLPYYEGKGTELQGKGTETRKNIQSGGYHNFTVKNKKNKKNRIK